jgi:hypothetical protein
MDLVKPIFIVGTGRCGSTIFHQIMAYHQQVSWLSNWAARFPHRPNYNRLALQLLDWPVISKWAPHRVYPVEAYNFWDRYSRGFSEPYRDLTAADVSTKTKKRVRRVLAETMAPQRDRLLVKITGWPRLSFLHEIFPDAKFIHIYRDGRAVVNSLLEVGWWSGWRGPNNWRWGPLTEAQQAKWLEHQQSYVALAAIEWEILMTAFDKAQQTIPAENYLQISYEALCAQPLETFQTALDFSDLPWTAQFEATVQNFSLRNTNDKWRKDLSPLQQNILNTILAESLSRYGYSPE